MPRSSCRPEVSADQPSVGSLFCGLALLAAGCGPQRLLCLAATAAEPEPTGSKNAVLSAQVQAVFELHRGFYGSPRIHQELKATGLKKLNEDIVVPRVRLVDLVDFAARLQKKTGFPIACFGHAGDGNIHTNLMVGDYQDPDTREKADHALDLLFNWVLENHGAITGEHGIGLAKKRWFHQAVGDVSLDVHEAVKRALDPAGLLNPGKFLD